MTLKQLRKRFPDTNVLAAPPDEGPFTHWLYLNTTEVKWIQPTSLYVAKDTLKTYRHMSAWTIKLFKKGD